MERAQKAQTDATAAAQAQAASAKAQVDAAKAQADANEKAADKAADKDCRQKNASPVRRGD